LVHAETKIEEMIMNNEIGFLRLPSVLELIPVSKSTFWAGCRTGRFPKPIKISPRITVWSKKSIIELAEKLSQGQDSGENESK
jgi:prophage regulatory protein